MSFFCPTFMRPDRLAQLADSWRECANGFPLHVRVWEKDPYREEYERRSWPDEWTVYVDGNEWAGQAWQAFYESDTERDYYGFIGDDVVLRSDNAIGELVEEAKDIYLAYPNDCLQRHHLSTHPCVGGNLARLVGYLVPPGIVHHNMDNVWHTIALNTGLLRYRPDVIFEHVHFLREKSDIDPTYARVYNDDKSLRADLQEEADMIFHLWLDKRAGKDIGKVRRELMRRYEGFEFDD